MTLGGTDIVLPVRNTGTAMRLALRAAISLWRHAVLEDADTGETFGDYREISIEGRQEILIYRDAVALAGWKELGADESLNGTMIHLIARDEELTIAVDDTPDKMIRNYMEAVGRALRQDIFTCRAGIDPPTRDAA